MEGSEVPLDGPGITMLSFDGGIPGRAEMMQLLVLKEMMQRVEYAKDLDETPRPDECFDLIGGSGVGGIFALWFAAWRMSVEEAIDAYMVLYNKVFTSEAWWGLDKGTSQQLFGDAMSDIASKRDKNAGKRLDKHSTDFDSCKGLTFTLNPVNMTFPGLFRTYKARSNRGPPCTILDALLASIADESHLSAIILDQPPEAFISATQHYGNPASELIKEALSVYSSTRGVACVVSIGAGRQPPAILMSSESSVNNSQANIARSAQMVEEDLERRCGNGRSFFFRLNLPHAVEDMSHSLTSSMSLLSAISVHTKQYLSMASSNKKLDNLVKLVVERKSTVTLERLNSIYGSDAQDQVLEAVKGVKANLDEHLSNSQDNRFHDLTTYLSPKHSIRSTLRDLRDIREEGTGHWLLTSIEFQKWISSENRMLSLRGIPGGGKTVLSSIVYDALQDKFGNNPRAIVLAMFINYNVTETIDEVLSCLLSQVVTDATGRILPQLDSLYRRRNHGRPNRNEIKEMLRFRLSTFSSAFIIVDGLDEFPSKDREDLIQVVLGLSQNVRLFVTCRPIPDLNVGSVSQLSLHLNASNISDMRLYVTNRILWDKRLSSVLRQESGITERVVETVHERSSGMFLLARFHLDDLSQYRTPAALETALSNLPLTAPSQYIAALNRIKHQSGKDATYGVHALIWVSLATRPLSMGELVIAIASSTNEVNASFGRHILSKDDVVDVCAGLIVARDGMAAFVHLTAQEFFKTHFTDSNSARSNEAQRKLGYGCLNYLKIPRKNKILSQLNPISYHLRTLQDPSMYFFWYCSLNWGTHFLDDRELDQLALEFFDVRDSFRASASILHYETNGTFRPPETGLYTALHMVAYFGLRSLCSRLIPNEDVNGLDPSGRCPLSYAAQSGHSSVVQLLTSKEDIDVDVNLADVDGNSPLMRATMNEHDGVVRLLLRRSEIKINTQNKFGSTALMMAARSNTQEIVLGLEDVDVNLVDKDGDSALICAAMEGSEDVVQLLLQRAEIKVNTQNSYGMTVLMIAAQNNMPKVVQAILCREELDVNLVDKDGRSALMLVAMKGGDDIVKLLLQRSEIKTNAQSNFGMTALMLAARYNRRATTVQAILSREDIDMNLVDENGYSPLIWAAIRGCKDVVERLLQRQEIKVNAQSDSGKSALIYAVKNKRPKVVQAILSRENVDVNLVDKDGDSALICAAMEGSEDVVELLLQRPEIKVNAQNIFGMTALMLAARYDMPEILRAILSREDIDVNLADKDGDSALMWAAIMGSEDVVESLLQRPEIKVNAQAKYGFTALMYAVRGGWPKVVKAILSCEDVNGNVVNSEGKTALSIARENEADDGEIDVEDGESEADDGESEADERESEADDVENEAVEVVELLLTHEATRKSPW